MNKTRFSISTRSLHGLIGSGLSLLDVPRQVAEHGISTLEVCHFHFPNTEAGFLSEFKAALSEAKVELYAVLMDAGDIASPDDDARENDLNIARHWIGVASDLGAGRVRVGAGRQPPTSDVIQRSAASLSQLAAFARERSIKVITENWCETSLQPLVLLDILKRCAGEVGLCGDTGNAEGPNKYETLALILPSATSIHFKAKYDDAGRIDLADLDRCVEAIKKARFDGPITLIYLNMKDEWPAVETLKTALSKHFFPETL